MTVGLKCLKIEDIFSEFSFLKLSANVIILKLCLGLILNVHKNSSLFSILRIIFILNQ